MKQSSYFCFILGNEKRSGTTRTRGGDVGTGCKGVCCVYSVQIIACFSAFSIEHNKKKEEKKENSSTQPYSNSKKHIKSVLSMLSGVKMLHTSC